MSIFRIFSSHKTSVIFRSASRIMGNDDRILVRSGSETDQSDCLFCKAQRTSLGEDARHENAHTAKA